MNGRDLTQCPLCGAEPNGVSALASYIDVYQIECRRCGSVKITGLLLRTKSIKPKIAPYLSAYTRECTETEKASEILDDSNFQGISQRFAKTPISTKLDRLLTLLSKRTGYHGAKARFSPEWDYPLIYAENSVEAVYHRSELASKGYVEIMKGDELIVTHAGWERLEKNEEMNARSAHKKGDKVKSWDVFISHASEDKSSVVEPLAEALKKRGLKVWYDRWVLTIGDSLRQSIDLGLSESRFGIVVLSQAFFQKNWPRWELDGLVQREIEEQKVILPVWYGVDKNDVTSYSPSLANIVAGTTRNGIESLADELVTAMETGLNESSSLENRQNVKDSPWEIIFQQGSIPFEQVNSDNPNIKIIRIGIKNCTNKKLESCYVRIEKILIPNRSSLFFIFDEPKISTPQPTKQLFSINPGDIEYIPIIQFDKINGGLAGLGIEVLCYSLEGYKNLDPRQEYIFSIRVSAEVGQPIECTYKVWLDNMTTLRFQETVADFVA